jgi:hypothetical protein
MGAVSGHEQAQVSTQALRAGSGLRNGLRVWRSAPGGLDCALRLGFARGRGHRHGRAGRQALGKRIMRRRCAQRLVAHATQQQAMAVVCAAVLGVGGGRAGGQVWACLGGRRQDGHAGELARRRGHVRRRLVAICMYVFRGYPHLVSERIKNILQVFDFP